MKIWRVEDEYVQGCYSAHLSELERMYQKHCKNSRTPVPYDDLMIERDLENDEICGFQTKEQALNWFSKYELRRLKKFGFELKEIEVDLITAYGQKQVLAIRKIEKQKSPKWLSEHIKT